MAKYTHHIAGALLALSLTSLGYAQSITIDSLDAAKAFTPGIDVAQPLDADAWQGTSATRALRLFGAMPIQSDHPVVRDMLRRVVLSGLVPPSGADEAFERARIEAAQTLASPDEYEKFAARNPAARDPRLRADAYIGAGDLAAACDISDTLQQGRGESYWVRLRAACHDLRDETSAADLARDILRDRGEEIDLVIPDPPDDFWARAMSLDAAALDRFMRDLAGEPEPILDAPELVGPAPEPTPLFPQTVSEPDPIVAPASPFDFDVVVNDLTDEGTAQLFVLAQSGDAKAVSAFVGRAVASGLNANRVLSRIPALLDPADMAQANLPLFARYAALTRDIGLMQALFAATDDVAAKEKLALAADALGGGYYGRSLGEDLETALFEDQPGAFKDVMKALGLGADLTEAVEQALAPLKTSSTDGVDWIAVDHAIDRGARAETLLRLAILIDQDENQSGWADYRVLRSLRKAGLSETAGQLAAYSYVQDL